MPYNRQTWTDYPSTATPLSADRLNYMEEGISRAYSGEKTRILSYSNGGSGGISTLGGSAQTSFRIPIRLPVASTRWRIKLRSYESYGSVSNPVLTGKKIIHGDHAVATAAPAMETGNFVGNTATTIVGADFTIPGDGSWYTSPWVTAAADQFDANMDHLIGIAWQAASTFQQKLGVGRVWFWNNLTSAVDPTVAGSTAGAPDGWVPIEYVIEYESTSTRSAWLCIGDSITEGTTGPRGAAIAPASLYRGYVSQWAASAKALVQNHSLYGRNASEVTNLSHTYWTRQNTAGIDWDGALIALGTNDLLSNHTITTMQTNLTIVINNVRSIIGAGKPIYMVNLLPMGMTGQMETNRIEINKWLACLPAGISGVMDADMAIRTAPGAAADPSLICSDKIHPSWQGHSVLANALRATLP